MNEQDAIARTGRLTAAALTLDEPDAWHVLSLHMLHRLTTGQRAAIMLAAMDSLGNEATEVILEAAGVIIPEVDPPIGSIFEGAHDAELWAAAATSDARRATVVAAFAAMQPNERRDFLAFARAAA